MSNRLGLSGVREDEVGPAGPIAAAHAERLLMIWLSPGFPVGAFAFSHGLEWAVERGLIAGRAGLFDWLEALLSFGSLRNDTILLAAAHRAAARGTTITEVAELAVALQPSGERHLETVMQGNAFIQQIRAAWPCAAIDRMAEAWTGDVAYPVAVGVAAAGHGIALGPTLEAYAVAVVSSLVSAAIRLSVIGQTDGQRVIADLMPAIVQASRAADRSSLADVGGAAWMSDLASLAHETQYTRLFRS